MYHYNECGLPNIFLVNGYRQEETDYGPAVTIDDIEGLHRTIGEALAQRADSLTGREFRFLRHELDLSQRVVAKMCDVEEQTVSLWERNADKLVPGAAAQLVKMLYLESIYGKVSVKENLCRLSTLDKQFHELRLELERSDEIWAQAA